MPGGDVCAAPAENLAEIGQLIFQAQIVSESAAYALGDYAHCRIDDLRVMRRGACEALPPANLEPAAFSDVLRDVASLAT